MSARPGPFHVHVADQILAALADAAPMPLSTPQVQDATGYGTRHGQLTYQVLTRLAKAGKVERSAAPGIKPVYWRTLATSEIDPATMPSLTARSHPPRRHPAHPASIGPPDTCAFGRGQCTVCGGMDGNHSSWCGHA